MPMMLRRDLLVDDAKDFGLGLVFVAVIDLADDALGGIQPRDDRAAMRHEVVAAAVGAGQRHQQGDALDPLDLEAAVSDRGSGCRHAMSPSGRQMKSFQNSREAPRHVKGASRRSSARRRRGPPRERAVAAGGWSARTIPHVRRNAGIFPFAWGRIVPSGREASSAKVRLARSMNSPFDKTGKSVTIREVAEAAGVSVGTVSRALNAPATVRPVTLEKVRAVIDRMGFQPDPRAQNMRRRTTMTVGFIINDITNPMHSNVFKAAEAELRPHGFTLHLDQHRRRAAARGGGDRHAPARPCRRADDDHQLGAGPRLPGAARHAARARRAARPRGADQHRLGDDRPCLGHAPGGRLPDRPRPPPDRADHRRAPTSCPAASGSAASSRPSRSAACPARRI